MEIGLSIDTDDNYGKIRYAWSMRGPERDVEIGQALRAARREIRCSQGQAAARMRELGWRWSQSTVSDLERGAKSLRLAEALDLAEVVGIPLERLAGSGHLPAASRDATGTGDYRGTLQRLVESLAARRVPQDDYVTEVAYALFFDLERLSVDLDAQLLPAALWDPWDRKDALASGLSGEGPLADLLIGLGSGAVDWSECVESLAELGVRPEALRPIAPLHRRCFLVLREAHTSPSLRAFLESAPQALVSDLQSLGRALRTELQDAAPRHNQLWSQP